MSESEKYEVLEKIGHGSFGVIHKVRRKSDGLVLCRKEISYTKMTPKEREQLQAELAILKELRHPNIVRYFEREHHKATQDLHLYMEYCGNGDLGQMIKRLKRMNQYAEEEFVWSVFAQLVTALYRCHYGEDPPEVGRNVMGLGKDAKPIKSKQSPYMILHRDLKPENVFLDADNSVKLGDFGLSKILQSHDFASTYVGTPFYMSPEICAAERYSLYSDIWSLGCIIYELCTKEPPFNARTHIELFHKIKAGRVAPLPPVYSQELQKVITTCLQVNPNSRPDTAQLLNLPVVKLMRKEQEVVKLGRQLKEQQELNEQKQKEIDEKLASVSADKELLKSQLDASVRREWEVKARLEIDRQVELETERLRKLFDSEVTKRVAAELDRLATTSRPPTHSKRSSTPAPTESRRSGSSHPVPAITASMSTLNTDSDFPSQTDLSSLSLESPFSSKPAPQPMKRSARTPFTRAHTVNNAAPVPSPMDITMADPSPITIASLALSPRRTGAAAERPKSNIFNAGEERWRPTNASAFPTPSASDVEDSPELDDDDDEDEEDDMPILPSPSRDPFKTMPKRPSLGRQKTAPANNTKRLASAPNLFARNGSGSGAGAAAASKRPSSAVPVVATSPARNKGVGSPGPKAKAIPMPVVSEAGSPVRKKGGVSELREAFGAAGLLKGKRGGEGNGNGAAAGGGGGGEMVKMALRNQIHGRTLVELAQARAGVEKENGKVCGGSKGSEKGREEKDRDVPLWDPERDEMPSPFLIRGNREVRVGLR